MAQLAMVPTAAGIEPPVAAWLRDNAATNAGIARYLEAGERIRVLTDVCWKIGAALFVLVAVAWMLGVLPGAVRLF